MKSFVYSQLRLGGGQASVLVLSAVLVICGFLLATADGEASPRGAATFGGLGSSQARGVVTAKTQAVIATDIVARVETLPFRAGDRFETGDLLIGFDCRRYVAELDAARAELRAAERTLKANIALKKHKAIGANELAVSRAKADKSRAQVRIFEVRTSQCEIKAPFSGRVVDLHINRFEMPRANEPLIRLVDDRSLEVDLIVPSKWLIWLRKGTSMTFTIDETRKAYSAKIARIGAVIDPVSQTIKVSARFESETDSVLPGMSGTASFRSPQG